LQAEKDVLGFFVSGHPLEKYADKLANLKVVDTATALEMKAPPSNGRRGEQSENEIAMAGILTGLKVAKSRKGDLYAQAGLEDMVGRIDIICFPEGYRKLGDKLKIDVPVLVRGVLRAEEDAAPKLAISSITALEDVKIKLPGSVRIRVSLKPERDDSLLVKLHEIVTAAPGPGRLMLDVDVEGDYLVMLEPEGVSVAADKGFVERVESLIGRGSVQLIQ
jgi:DNA polymerase-3 subunit alpha